MSILIRGMEMPKDCSECRFCEWKDGDDVGCVATGKGADDCPLIELPDHGDLIDMDEFIGRLQSWALLIAMGHGDDDEWVKCIGEVCDHLYNASVVIPAERSEE